VDILEHQELLTARITRCRFVQFKLVTPLLETRRESFNLLLRAAVSVACVIRFWRCHPRVRAGFFQFKGDIFPS
jgi:hypothetical protein